MCAYLRRRPNPAAAAAQLAKAPVRAAPQAAGARAGGNGEAVSIADPSNPTDHAVHDDETSTDRGTAGTADADSDEIRWATLTPTLRLHRARQVGDD